MLGAREIRVEVSRSVVRALLCVHLQDLYAPLTGALWVGLPALGPFATLQRNAFFRATIDDCLVMRSTQPSLLSALSSLATDSCASIMEASVAFWAHRRTWTLVACHTFLEFLVVRL